MLCIAMGRIVLVHDLAIYASGENFGVHSSPMLSIQMITFHM